MTTHSNILAWRIPWPEEPGGLQSVGSQSDTTEVTYHAQMQACFARNVNRYSLEIRKII